MPPRKPSRPGRKAGPASAGTPIRPDAIARPRPVATPGDPPTPEAVGELATTLGFAFTPAQLKATVAYLEMLERWNRSVNLVGPETWRTILAELIPDSWFLARFLDTLPPCERILDLGAGGGLPGIPLRIVRPQGRYVLVEPRQKRAAFLRNAVAIAGLTGTPVFPGRAEDLPAAHLPADLVLSRAFRPWPEVLAIAAELLRPDGLCVIMSSDSPPDSAPAGWTLAATADYPVRQGRAWLWAFARIRNDS